MAFQETTSQDGILLKTVQASSMLPHFAYMSIKLLYTVNLLGLILLVAFSDCPPFTYVVSFSFHGKMCNSELGPGAIAAISAATHGGFHQLSSQSASAVSLSVKSGYLSFVYNKDPGQADQPCRIHIPGINVIIRMKNAAPTFSISILHLLTFSSLLLSSHQCKGCERSYANV